MIGGKEEYFTVDTRELQNVEIGDEEIPLPTHIDIQERVDRNSYKKVRKVPIDWDELLKHSDDIIEHFRKNERKKYKGK